MSSEVTNEQMEKLALALEEATRATRGDAAPIFVEPAAGTLARSLSKRHHIVFGRRGSGKTSLLQKARAELVLNRRPNAFVDLEKFKGHSYPDVLISVLIETFGEIRSWLQQGAVLPASKQSFWRKWFSKPQRDPLKGQTAAALAGQLQKFEDELTDLLHAQDDAEMKTLCKVGSTSGRSGGVGARLGGGGAQVSVDAREDHQKSRSDEVKESVRRSKADLLHRRVIEYQRVLREVVKLSDEDGFLLLDDLYHIPRDTQAQILDYFHRLLKGTGFWLKVGTIRHRSRWYRHGTRLSG